MEKQLYYSAITEPFPLQASVEGQPLSIATLTIIATNNSGNDVTLQGIIVRIPVGLDSTQLTNDAADVQPVSPPNWHKPDLNPSKGYMSYVFRPEEGYGTLPANSALNFILANLPVNTAPGAVNIDVTEGSGGCVPPNCPTQTISVTKFPHGWGQVSLYVNPPVLPQGGSVQLQWDGPAGATYTIEYYTPQSGIVTVPAAGAPPLPNQGVYPGVGNPPLTLRQTTVFTLNVEETINHNTYHAQEQKTATVENPSPEVSKFTITAMPFDNNNPPTFKLEWILKNAGNFEITAQWGNNPPVALTGIPRDATSTLVYPVAAQTNYKITAYESLRKKSK